MTDKFFFCWDFYLQKKPRVRIFLPVASFSFYKGEYCANSRLGPKFKSPALRRRADSHPFLDVYPVYVHILRRRLREKNRRDLVDSVAIGQCPGQSGRRLLCRSLRTEKNDGYRLRRGSRHLFLLCIGQFALVFLTGLVICLLYRFRGVSIHLLAGQVTP